MIKASELRIGNLLGWETEHRSGPIFKVVAIGEEKFEMESCNDRVMDRQPLIIESSFDIEPIPLTPEWLKQFGWQVVDQGSGPYYWLEKQCWFHIHLSADGSFYANFNNNAVPIKYHHQLQNLYFALTGEELTTE